MRRLDRFLVWMTPLMVAAVLVVTMSLLAATQAQLKANAERSEQRTERLVELLEENREEWGPALEESLELLTRLCDTTDGCEVPG